MSNKIRFRVCRGCLMSSAAADLIDMFEESGEILKKFQEISRIDISKDKNKNYALICRECLMKVETGFEIGRTLKNTEKHYFSKLRGKFGGEIEASEEEETGILMVNEELEENETLTSILDVLNEDLDKYLEEAYEELVQGGVTDIIVGDCHQVQNLKSFEGSSSSDGELSLLEVDSREEELQAAVEENEENEASQDELEGESAAVMESENSLEDSIEVSEKQATQEESSAMFASASDNTMDQKMLTPKEIGENSISNEEMEEHQEVRIVDVATVEVEDVDPVDFYSEFTVEETSGLNLKEPKIIAEKVNSSKAKQTIGKNKRKEGKIRSRKKVQEKSQAKDATKRSYEQKIKIVEGKKVIKCSDCSLEFPSNWNLKRHMMKHELTNDNTSNQNRPFKCSFKGCGKFFKSKGHLNRHERSHNPEKVKCSICSKDYASKGSLRFHVEHSHIKKNIFKCDCCPKIFNRKQYFLSHFKNVHMKKKKNYPKPSVMTSKHCSFCFRLFSTRHSLKQHIEVVHEKKWNFACDFCSKTFYYKNDLRNHIATHIFVNDDSSNANRPHQCDFDGCGKYFRTKHALRHHKKALHNLKFKTR